MPTNTLTDARVRALKPAEKATKHFDGGGLYVWVSPKGAKVWRLAYRVASKPQTISLGAYPEVGLAEARLRRDEIRAQLRRGEDPMAPRRAQRGTLKFKQACETYWGGRKDLSPAYVDNARRALEMHLYPRLGDSLIGSIGRAELLEALNVMDAAGLHVYVRKTRMWVGQVFDWAVEQGEAEVNPAKLIDPAKAFGRRRVVHMASLPLDEVAGLLQRLALEAELQSVLACRLLAYTWVRTNELRFMTWAEVSGDVWRIPAARMKMDRDHMVPLPAQAVAILAKLKARSRGGDYVFPAEHRLDRTISENTILALLTRMGYKGRMTGHGWRTIASTWANEAGHRGEAVERQLAHAPDDKVRAVYNRAEYLPERRAMLQAWADWLDAQERRAE